MKKGDKVIFNNKFGLDKKYPDIYTVISDPWKIGENQLVKIDGFQGGFRIEGLTKVGD